MNKRNSTKKLYSKNPTIKFTLESTGKMYSEEEKAEINAPFEFDNFRAALKLMARGKAPGNDGLGAEFYIVMFSKIGHCLWNVVLESHSNGFLYRSARWGIISLIPKKDKNSLYISKTGDH